MEAESSIGACIVRKEITEGHKPLRINTTALHDYGFRLRIASILPDLIVTYKTKTAFFVLASEDEQISKFLDRAGVVLSQFKSCILILPCSSSIEHLVSDHIANHEEVSYIFSDEDPILLAIETAESLHPESLESLAEQVSNDWLTRVSSWEAFDVAVGALRLGSSAQPFSIYQSLQGIARATSRPNPVDDIADLTGMSRESAESLVQVFQIDKRQGTRSTLGSTDMADH